MRLGKTTIVLFISKVAVSIAGFVGTFAIARILGSDILGVYTIVLALLFWLTIPSNAVTSAIIKRVSEGESPGEFLTTGLLLSSVLALATATIVFLSRTYVNEYVGASVHSLLAVLVVGYIVFRYVLGGLKGQKRVAMAGASQAMERVLRASLQIGVILLGFELTGILAGHVVSYLLTAGMAYLAFRVPLKRPGRRHVQGLFTYARYSWLGTLRDRTFGSLDIVVLAWFVLPSLIGIYQVAWNLASMLIMVSSSISQTLFPELSGEDSHDRIHHLLNEGLVFTGVFAIPGLFGAAVVGPRLLKIYRPEFAKGATILVILIAAQMLAAFGMQFVSTINAMDRPDIGFRINLAFVGANFLLNVTLIPVFGWHGAAVATLLSAVVPVSFGYLSITNLMGRPRLPYREIAFEVVSGVIMALTLVGILPTVPENHYATVGIIFLGAGIYATVLLAVSTRIRKKTFRLFPVALSNAFS